MAFFDSTVGVLQAKAIYRIRRIVLVNTEIIDEYMENLCSLDDAFG